MVRRLKPKRNQKSQDGIFRKMSAAKKIKLTADFSMFLHNINRQTRKNGFSRAIVKNR